MQNANFKLKIAKFSYLKRVNQFAFFDEFVKSRKRLMIVIPAKAGIQ